VVETFANLIHENQRAGIIVTHDLRMCRYVDRVLQMRDGQLVRTYDAREEIDELARSGTH
jgi:putative ABC transport system ATP-binding protein